MFSNRMTKLLDKIEISLGMQILNPNLPANIKKGDPWVNTINLFTLDTFSRYFPNKVRVTLTNADKKGDYFFIDEEKIGGDIEIIGVRDIAWDDPFTMSSAGLNSQLYGSIDFYASMASLEDIGLAQLVSDQTSLFNNGIYIDFIEPNRVKLVNTTGAPMNINEFKIDVFIKHALNLNTISPTKMETFEQLATADVAKMLYNNLKFFDNSETVFGNLDLKLNELEQEAQKREMIVDKLESSYVSPSNDHQPMMITV